ncbi:MAG: hypothetical protein Kow0062_06420 [Acidobacteriota bacterium]
MADRDQLHDAHAVEIEQGEPWEPWETRLVLWSLAIGVVVLVIGGWIVHATILSH